VFQSKRTFREITKKTGVTTTSKTTAKKVEKQTALKVRFIANVGSGGVIFILALKIDEELCGYTDQSLSKSPLIEIFQRNAGWVITQIDELKMNLIEFAENNAFHGKDKDKSVPRIEMSVADGYAVWIEGDSGGPTRDVSFEAMEAIESLIGHKIPIYEDKPLFEHSWKKVFPFEDSYATFQAVGTAKEIYKRQDALGIEVYEFEMWRV